VYDFVWGMSRPRGACWGRAMTSAFPTHQAPMATPVAPLHKITFHLVNETCNYPLNLFGNLILSRHLLIMQMSKLPSDSATRAISSVPVTSSSAHWKNLKISFRKQSTVSVTCASRWWTLHLGGVVLPPLDPPRKRHGPPFSSSPLWSQKEEEDTRKTFKKWEKRHLPGGIYLADIVLTEQKRKVEKKYNNK
jgi:hypothetical protein